MKILLLFLLSIPLLSSGQTMQWHNITPVTDASFRGVSAVDDSIAWVSGSKGWVGTSTDGGKNWTLAQVKGYEKCDFRSIYAFDARRAIIANAGTPAYILTTNDGGNTWKEVYKNEDTAAFIDGIDFRNSKDGIIYGDPINGRLLLLRTRDGGKSWKELPIGSKPLLIKDEASFAASGTCIRYLKHGKILIATGGVISRFWVSKNNGKRWKTINTPILQGQNSTGIFSFALGRKKGGIIVGGDYKSDTLKKDHVFYTKNGGKTWIAPEKPTRGYRECVTMTDRNTAIAIGPGGSDISYNGGRIWEPLSDEKQFHVIRKSRKGSLIILAGGGGKIAWYRNEN